MQKKFKREIQSLGEVFDFIDQYSSAHPIRESALFSVKFVIEELFTNMVKYNISPTKKDILLDLDRQGKQLVIRLTDFDVDKFDITTVGDADVSLPLEERKIGGLGIHLIKRMVDTIHYQYSNRESIITLTKNLESEYV